MIHGYEEPSPYYFRGVLVKLFNCKELRKQFDPEKENFTLQSQNYTYLDRPIETNYNFEKTKVVKFFDCSKCEKQFVCAQENFNRHSQICKVPEANEDVNENDTTNSSDKKIGNGNIDSIEILQFPAAK